jgi:hypothetical protein
MNGLAPDGYCPYCNRSGRAELTDEHVIPRCIGGDERFVIRVCKPCNDTAGHRLDARLCAFTGLRALGWATGNVMTRHERHPSTGVLIDGRTLDGYFYWIVEGNDQFRPAFQPKKLQADGTIWIALTPGVDVSKLPRGYNVYSEDMLDRASFTNTSPIGADTVTLPPASRALIL